MIRRIYIIFKKEVFKNTMGVTVAWSDEGKFHRLDGPAVMLSRGAELWYEEGILLGTEDWDDQDFYP